MDALVACCLVIEAVHQSRDWNLIVEGTALVNRSALNSPPYYFIPSLSVNQPPVGDGVICIIEWGQEKAGEFTYSCK